MTNLQNPVQYEDAIKMAHAKTIEKLKNINNDFQNMTDYLANVQGKGIRTKLLFSAAMNEEKMVPFEAIQIAVAIELLHLATLVHDDVIDDANLRRNQTTLHKKFGSKEAVLCGDYLLCLSFSEVASLYNLQKEKEYSQVIPYMSNAITKICLGELKQLKNNRNMQLSFHEYLRIISGKTAALFYIAAYAGALVGGESDKNARAIAQFGQMTGMIFQMLDDCKDYECSQEQAMKPVLNDLKEGIVTLPLILAIMRNPNLQDVARQAMETKKDFENVARMVFQTGAVGDSKQIVQRYYKKAIQKISKIENVHKRNALQLVLEKSLENPAQCIEKS